MDHGPFKSEDTYRTLQLIDCGLRLRHRQRSKSGETSGMSGNSSSQLIVRLSRQPHSFVIGKRLRQCHMRNDLKVDATGVHTLQTNSIQITEFHPQLVSTCLIRSTSSLLTGGPSFRRLFKPLSQKMFFNGNSSHSYSSSKKRCVSSTPPHLPLRLDPYSA